jgi:3-oxoadipate enol-lactonase
MHIVDIAGVRLHCSVSGPADGMPLVFANSLGTDFRIWDSVVALLPPGLRILRYDMRGHGLSDAPEGDYQMGDVVGETAALMEVTGFRDAVFVGLSIGGIVAQGIAVERPDLVRAAVLSSTAAKIGTGASWRDRIATVRRSDIEAIADGLMEKWFTPSFHDRKPDELAGWRHMLTRTPVDGYVGCCAAIAATDLRESTPGIRQPVLALVGDADGSTPPDLVRETADSIEGSRFEIVRGAGHIPCVEQPKATADLIAGFLEEIDHG